jgi:hypothetical protein
MAVVANTDGTWFVGYGSTAEEAVRNETDKSTAAGYNVPDGLRGHCAWDN